MPYNPTLALELLRLGTQNPAAAFHDGQEEAIQYVVDGRGRLLVVQKTGWGKSSVDFIATKLLRGLGKPVGQIPAPVLFGYDPSVAPTRYDPELAKKLVAESGYKGEKIVFQYPNNRWAFAEEVAQAVGGYLKTVGIQAELQSMEFSAFFPLWLGNKLGSMYMFSLGITVMDADLILNLEYESGSSHGYWVNAEVDALAKQQRAETNPQVRKEILGRIWRMSQQNAWFAPLYQEIQAYGISDRVKWAPRPDERLNFENVEVVAKK